MPPKFREIIKRLEDDGWRQVAQKGSHRQFKHDSKPGRVTVPGQGNAEPSPDTLRSKRNQAGWTK